MTKIFAIGSSHLAAIKLGWDVIKNDYPNIDFSFFGAPAEDFYRLQLNEKHEFGFVGTADLPEDRLDFISRTNGRLSVDLSEADHVLHVGWPIDEQLNAELLTNWAIDGFHANDGARLLSMSAYKAFLSGIINDVLPPAEWRGWTSPRLIFVPKPRITEGIRGGDSTTVKGWRDLLEAGTADATKLGLFLDMLVTQFRKSGIEVVIPPNDVYGASGLIKTEFARSTSSAETGQTKGNDGDHTHMNERYGALMLRRILDNL